MLKLLWISLMLVFHFQFLKSMYFTILWAARLFIFKPHG